MATMSAKKAAKLLGAQIERLYGQRCSGIPIDIMKIGSVFAVAKAAHAKGEDMGDAIAAYVETIRADKPRAPAPPPLFPMGRIVTTAAVASEVPSILVQALLARHAKGDWGDVDASDAQANVDALTSGDRLLSSYTPAHATAAGPRKLWIITEADRSLTTVLFPEEY